MNLNYIHSVARRGITGNDNIGISPYDVFSYTPGFVNLQKTPAPDRGTSSTRSGPPIRSLMRNEINTPQTDEPIHIGGGIYWTPWKTEHQSLQVNANGGADLASLNDLLYAPPSLQVEQRVPSGLPGTSVSNTAQINYFNYTTQPHPPLHRAIVARCDHVAGLLPRPANQREPGDGRVQLARRRQRADGRHGPAQLLLPHRAAGSVVLRERAAAHAGLKAARSPPE